VWKIVKNLLPAKAVELVKFVDKKNIREFVKEDNVFVHMGGKDKFAYRYTLNIFVPDHDADLNEINIA
jgi:hypothetical protein